MRGYDRAMSEPAVVKKYGNRRLYDTSISRYVTLDELAERVAGGGQIRVVDAKSGRDLTAATLTQIIVEGRELSRLLPVPLLEQLIRLGDDALAEFFGKWVVGALEVYLQARSGLRAPPVWNPLSALSPIGDALMRMWMGGAPEPPAQGEASAGATTGATSTADEVAELRRELEQLRREIKGAGKSGTGGRGRKKR